MSKVIVNDFFLLESFHNKEKCYEHNFPQFSCLVYITSNKSIISLLNKLRLFLDK